jgi:hypothetical protein
VPLATPVGERPAQRVVPVTSVRLTAVPNHHNSAVTCSRRDRPARRATSEPAEVKTETMGAPEVEDRAGPDLEQLEVRATVDHPGRRDAGHGCRHDRHRATRTIATFRLGAWAVADIESMREDDRLDSSRCRPPTSRVPARDEPRCRGTCERQGAREQGCPGSRRPGSQRATHDGSTSSGVFVIWTLLRPSMPIT